MRHIRNLSVVLLLWITTSVINPVGVLATCGQWTGCVNAGDCNNLGAYCNSVCTSTCGNNTGGSFTSGSCGDQGSCDEGSLVANITCQCYTCSPDGYQCQSDGDCCLGDCGLSGICGVSCNPDNFGCGSNSDCCNFDCGPSGVCGDYCYPSDWGCGSDSDCCSGACDQTYWVCY